MGLNLQVRNSWLARRIVLLHMLLLFPDICIHGGREINNATARDSFNSFLYTYVLRSIPKIRTGTLYDVAPPPNMSGVAISVVRLRTHRLWTDGVNLTSIEIPPKTTLPRPFTRRINIVYQNLGNLSTFYYDNIVPSHTLVAPVLSFLAYDSSNLRSSPVELATKQSTDDDDDDIVVHFPMSQRATRAKCVRFYTNGTFEMSEVGPNMTCRTTGSGHFSLVIPQEQSKIKKKKKGFEGWKIGVIVGGTIVGLMGIMGVLGHKLWTWRKVRRMERVAERSEGLGTMWIGDARMPIAQGMRTLPLLENNYVP